MNGASHITSGTHQHHPRDYEMNIEKRINNDSLEYAKAENKRVKTQTRAEWLKEYSREHLNKDFDRIFKS